MDVNGSTESPTLISSLFSSPSTSSSPSLLLLSSPWSPMASNPNASIGHYNITTDQHGDNIGHNNVVLSSFEQFCGNSPFWDTGLLLNSSYPKFTPCFAQVGLVWIPCLLYILACVPYICWVRGRAPLAISPKLLGISKTVCTVCLLGITIATIIVRATDVNKESIPDALYVSEGLKTFCFVLSLHISRMERARGVVASLINWSFWFLLLVATFVPFYTNLEEDTFHTDRVGYVIFYIYFALVLVSFILACFSEAGTKYASPSLSSLSSNKSPSPESSASIPSRLSFMWMTSLVVLGFKKSLEDDDVFDLDSSDQCETLVSSFKTAWQKETKRAEKYNSKVVVSNIPVTAEEERLNNDGEERRGGSKQSAKSPYKPISLLRALGVDYGFVLLFSMTSHCLFGLLKFLTPMITEALMEYTLHRQDFYKWRGYVLALSYLVVNMIVSLGSNLAIFYTRRAGMRMRTVLVNAIYRKSLTAAHLGDETSRGEVVNLMSVDAEHIQYASNNITYSFSAPAQVILAFYLLHRQLGGAAMFSSLAVMLLMFPINIVVGYMVMKWSVVMLKLKDKRIHLLSEALSGIKALKLYAWEGIFQSKVDDIRHQELKVIKFFYKMDAFILLTFLCLPTVVQMTAYGIHVTDAGYLDPTVAFVSLQLFQMVNNYIMLLPFSIPSIMRVLVSVGRINVYLNKPDIKPDAICTDVDADCAVKIENGEFRWSAERPQPTLRDINLEVAPCSLVAVVGAVGSGKSSLLSAMLGEMDKLEGQVTVKSSLAYVPQQAWIQNGKLQDNILFGSNFHTKKYENIVESCALQLDFDILPGGDQTEIGEKGINISGGQKQRVSLARAVYSDRDIYLLDDPLSAVDSHVGRHIFNHVIGQQGLLKNKTRILVTHGIKWLPMMDKILVMSNGVISETGTYNELLEMDGEFAQLLKEYAQEQDNSESWSDDDNYSREKDGASEYGNGHCRPVIDSDSLTWKETSFSVPSLEDEKTSLKKRRLSSSSSYRSLIDPGAEKSRNGVGDKKSHKAGTKLVEDETEGVGNVKLHVYQYYLKEIGATVVVLCLLIYLLFVATTVFSGIWLTKWTSDTYLSNSSLQDTDEYQHRTNMYIGVFGVAVAAQGLLICFVSVVIMIGVVKAAQSIHKNMLYNVLRSPMSFFDMTPIGRLQNRFSKDIEIIDRSLPDSMRKTLSSLSHVLITIVNISYATPIFLAVFAPLAIVYFIVQTVYIPTIRQLQRINAVTRSPIHVQFSETLGGTASIRAYRCQDRFINQFMEKIDHNVKYHFASNAAIGWLSFCLQMISILVVFAAAILAVSATDIDASLVGLSVSYAATMTIMLEDLVTVMSKMETNIVSVERIKEYTVSPQEAPWVLEEHQPQPSWPENGCIEFDNYQTRYRPGLDLVLHGLSCHVQAGEKVGIVGRTGAGKSSMSLALFRMIEAAGGRIVIDGEDLSHMGLHDLRNKITILPQDPVVFSGSLRLNLDPFGKHTDSELWSALELSYLKEFVQQLPQCLDYDCGQEGTNFSVGQKQLLCLARTFLRKTKILILDEATAAVDIETDGLIHQTIRTQFQECTVLTIAHRLNTILNYDRVMVLDQGRIKQFDSPEALLTDKEGMFYSMAKDAGIA